jgi:hypothetical protein
MTENHPITPPPELVKQWREAPEFSALSPCVMVTVTNTKLQDIATQAARWGADQELEACCKMLYDRYDRVRHATGFPGSDMSDWLRAARRPKPPSLKEQAMRVLLESGYTFDGRMEIEPEGIHIIQRALESIDE